MEHISNARQKVYLWNMKRPWKRWKWKPVSTSHCESLRTESTCWNNNRIFSSYSIIKSTCVTCCVWICDATTDVYKYSTHLMLFFQTYCTVSQNSMSCEWVGSVFILVAPLFLCLPPEIQRQRWVLKENICFMSNKIWIGKSGIKLMPSTFEDKDVIRDYTKYRTGFGLPCIHLTIDNHC